MQVLEHEHQRLRLTLPKQEQCGRLERPLASRRSVGGVPLVVVDTLVEQREHGRTESGGEAGVEDIEGADDLHADLDRAVPVLDPDVALEQAADGEVRRRPRVRDRLGFQQATAGQVVGMGGLPQQPGLPHAWVADDAHHLPVPGGHPFPSATDDADLDDAPHEPILACA